MQVFIYIIDKHKLQASTDGRGKSNDDDDDDDNNNNNNNNNNTTYAKEIVSNNVNGTELTQVFVVTVANLRVPQ
jgi:hypothetical protein